MLSLRSIAVVSLWFGACALVACGGGGGGGGVGTAVVAGQVILRDGTTENLGGIQVSLTGLGITATTAADGSFSFGSVPTGNLAVSVRDPLAPIAVRAASTEHDGEHEDGEDHDGEHEDGEHHDGEHEDGEHHEDEHHETTEGERDDHDGDSHDVGDGDFDFEEVETGDDVTITITMRDGKIESVDICHRGSGGHDEGRVALARTIDSDDADAEGSARLESRVDRQRMSVEAEHFDAGRVLEAFVTRDGVEASLGTRTVGATGEAEWEIATNDGGVLPLAATTVAELAGADVEVRDAVTGTVLLEGTLPEVRTPEDVAAPHVGTGSRGRSALEATIGHAGSGHVDVRRRVETVVEGKFEVEVEQLAAGLIVEVWMENGVGTGVLARIGTLSVGVHGEAELELDSGDGDALPFGVLDVADLVGRDVEIRRASDGAVILTGVVPALVSEK